MKLDIWQLAAVEKSKNQGLVVCDSSPDFSGDSTGLGLPPFFFPPRFQLARSPTKYIFS